MNAIYINVIIIIDYRFSQKLNNYCVIIILEVYSMMKRNVYMYVFRRY